MIFWGIYFEIKIKMRYILCAAIKITFLLQKEIFKCKFWKHSNRCASQKIVVRFIMLQLMTGEIAGAQVVTKCCFLCICGELDRSQKPANDHLWFVRWEIRLFINNDGWNKTVACLFVLESTCIELFFLHQPTYDASSLCRLSHANLVFLDAVASRLSEQLFNPMKTLICADTCIHMIDESRESTVICFENIFI